MNLIVNPKGFLQIDNAKIIYRNFSGAPSKYNREGDRNFAVIIEDEDVANKLIEDSWNVKIKPPREEGESPFIYLPVKLKFNERGPIVYLKTGENMNRLTEDNVGMLDNVVITNVDMDIRPYDGGPINGKCGRAAYVQSICVEQEVDRFTERFMAEPEQELGEEIPF